ncbi:hypothetical protein HKX48_001963 [Thoreauomyces humboldtii]|nr:hypothetical protein HKX48_001963 [Thoreauomyces humboldtii]
MSRPHPEESASTPRRAAVQIESASVKASDTNSRLDEKFRTPLPFTPASKILLGGALATHFETPYSDFEYNYHEIDQYVNDDYQAKQRDISATPARITSLPDQGLMPEIDTPINTGRKRLASTSNGEAFASRTLLENLAPTVYLSSEGDSDPINIFQAEDHLADELRSDSAASVPSPLILGSPASDIIISDDESLQLIASLETNAFAVIDDTPAPVRTAISDNVAEMTSVPQPGDSNDGEDMFLLTYTYRQADCLQLDGVLEGTKNLLYSAPTSGGKSLVADIVMLQKVTRTKKKAIMIVPFVALASERTKVMQNVFASEPLKIVGYYSDVGSATFDNVDIAYCTIEKANSLVNRLIEEDKLEDLGIVVVDEIHMAGDPQRGYLLELLLTKLSFILDGKLQIVAMSATLPNIDIFKRWLKSHLYITDFRPVPLTEFIKLEGNLYDHSGQLLHTLGKKTKDDPNWLVPLVAPVLQASASVLIFCGSKRYCENTARHLATELPKVILPDDEIMAQRRGVVRELERTPGSLDVDLANFIMAGVAFHHAGLITEERDIIEDAYRAGILRVIACTSTLAMGVNLPARRVIFREVTPYGGLSARQYQQMRGRAGRKGLDSHGESILMCENRSDMKTAQALISSTLPPITSCLLTEVKGMKRALLEVIVAGVAVTNADLLKYLQYTLLYAEHGRLESETHECMEEALRFLVTNRFIEAAPTGKHLATRLGRAAVYSSLSPEEALTVYEELQRAGSCFALNEELHTVYLVTPVYMDEKLVNWTKYLEHYMAMMGDPRRKNVADLLRIDEQHLMRAHMKHGWAPDFHVESRPVHKRFYIAMILYDLVQEKDFDYILQKYGNISRGDLQSLQTQSGSFAGMVKIFCQQLGWSNLVAIVDKFQERLCFGVTADLVELMQIPEIGGVRARLLYSNGFKDVTALAAATIDEVYQVLRKGAAFHPSDKDRDAQTRLLYRAAHMISQGAIKVVQAQLHEATIDAQRKRNLLARVRDLSSPASGKRATQIQRSQISRRTPRSNTRHLKNADVDTPCPIKGSHILVRSVVTPSSVETVPYAVTADRDISSTKGSFYLIDATESKLSWQEFLLLWETKKEYAWNSHTLADPKQGKKLISLSVCWELDTVYNLDVTSNLFEWEGIRKVFEKRSVKHCCDAKSQLRLLISKSVMPAPTFRDPKIAAWLLAPDSPEKHLQELYRSTFPHDPGPPPTFRVEQSTARGAWQTLKLSRFLDLRIESEGLTAHYTGIEMPIAPILAKMEHAGVGFMEQEFQAYYGMFKKALTDLETRAYGLAGCTFALSEPRDVARILYDKLGLPYHTALDPIMKREDDRRRAAGKKLWRRTCKDVLQRLESQHEMPGIVMEHRRLSLIISTHLIPVQSAQLPSTEFQMPRIKTTLQTHTATGRVTSTNPNLQNIPHPRLDGDGSSVDSVNIRNAFRAADGMVLLAADYSQVELRIIASLSKDENMISLISSGDDFFRTLASRIHGRPIEAITKTERDDAKALTYGVMYGKGPTAIAEDLRVSLGEASKFLKNLNAQYPKIGQWKQRVMQGCYEKGYVETMLGRRRRLPAIHSSSSTERSHAERQSINTTVQGSAADLIKVAMAHLDKKFREKKWGAWMSDGTDPRLVPHLILQIHDELLFEVPVGLVDTIRDVIKDCMENTVVLEVPIKVRFKMGKSWGDMK